MAGPGRGGAGAGPRLVGKHRVVQTGQWMAPGSGIRCIITACSDAGCSVDGNRKTNQDSYLIDLPRADAPSLLVGVFDGHGEHGHIVSRQVKAQFGKLFAAARQQRPDLSGAITAAYLEQDHACTVSIDCSQSGTTAVTCLLEYDKEERQVLSTQSPPTAHCVSHKMTAESRRVRISCRQ